MKLTSILACLAGAALTASAGAQLVTNVQYIGQQTFPTSLTFGGTTVGGLSGIAYDAASNSYFSIADDRSPAARFYNLGINLSDGTLDNGDVTFNSVTNLRRPDGSQFANLTLDPEGIAIAPSGDVFVSSEGDVNNNFQPFINRFSQTTGQQNQALAVPARFASTGPAGTSGIRNNLAFETLTVSPSGSSLFTATENALRQDGPAAAVGVGSPSRILRYDLATGLPAQEFVYNTEAVAEVPNPSNGFATNGLVDMLALDETNFLALERSFSAGAVGAGGTGNIIKLFLVSLDGATDVSNRDALGLAGTYTAASKSLLLDLSTLGIALDNIEGLTFGPTLANGKQSIILVSDNNFSATQFTQFVALSVNVVPTPGTGALVGIAGLVAIRRRR